MNEPGKATAALDAFVRKVLGFEPRDLAPFQQAVTHPSHGKRNYQRLEFLGDRVLGLVVAEWLFERFPDQAEGQLSHRFTVLVSRSTCGEIGERIGVPALLRLGKQARDDGAAHSENVVGDAVEALVGALFREGGLDAARAFVRRAWAEHIDAQKDAPRHPKSLLHEWAEGNRRKAPVYEVVDRSGPPHAPRFTVRASVRGLGEAEAEGSSKQEAETAAAAALLAALQPPPA